MTELAELQQRNREAALDDILSRWHHWAQSKDTVRGYGSRALVCGEYRTSRQYDDVNGALDDDLEADTMKRVDFQVREMPEPWRSAIYVQAKSLYTGVAVFRSPRIDASEWAEVLAQARVRITQRLISAGVME